MPNAATTLSRLETDRDKTINRSPIGLVKPVHKFAKSVNETNRKVHKLLTYNEAINDPIYRNK